MVWQWAPRGQAPVVVAHSILELLHGVVCQRHRTDLRVVAHRRAELNGKAAADQVIPLEHLAQIVPAVLELRDRLGRAEGQRVVHVGLLRVVVRPDLVDPEIDNLCLREAVRVLVGGRQAAEHQRQEPRQCPLCGHGRMG